MVRKAEAVYRASDSQMPHAFTAPASPACQIWLPRGSEGKLLSRSRMAELG